MKREVTHDQAVAELEAVAVDALDPEERELVLGHVAGCADCREMLRSLREVATQLALSTASNGSSQSRARIRSRLMARAAADAARPAVALAAGAPLHGSPASGSSARQFTATQPIATEYVSAQRKNEARSLNVLAWRRAEWVAMAASVFLVVSVGLLASTMRERSDIRDALKEQLSYAHVAARQSDSLNLLLASRDSLIAGLTGRDVAVMSLTSSGANAPFARMFWDQGHNTWTLVAHNMPALKPGRTYQLWLVTASKKISAGTFDAQNGEALVRATYALSPADLKALAVTEEPAGGVPQPTGAPVIAVAAH